jgi:hypothetical protein
VIKAYERPRRRATTGARAPEATGSVKNTLWPQQADKTNQHPSFQIAMKLCKLRFVLLLAPPEKAALSMAA